MSFYPFAKINEQPIERETEEVLALWEEVGAGGLDIWVELPAAYAVPDGSDGDPGRSYDYSSLVGDYLATLEREEAHEGYCAWLNYALTRLRAREEG